MSLTQLFELIETLPPTMQQEVALFVRYLQLKQDESGKISHPTIHWAEKPKTSALLGLTKHKPLNIKEVRRKAWQR